MSIKIKRSYKNFFVVTFLVLFFILNFFVSTPAWAQYICCDKQGNASGSYETAEDCTPDCANKSGNCAFEACPGSPDEEAGIVAPEASEGIPSVALPNPLGTMNLRAIIGNIINMLIGVAGSIALLMFVYGGMLWLTSAGNAEKIKKGQAIILWSVLGMVVMFSAYIIVRYVLGAILVGAGKTF